MKPVRGVDRAAWQPGKIQIRHNQELDIIKAHCDEQALHFVPMRMVVSLKDSVETADRAISRMIK